MTETKLSKTDIISYIKTEENFNRILQAYKDTNVSATLYKFSFDQIEKANGLLSNIYVFHKDKTIIDILLPIFTTEKTATWNFKYNEMIFDILHTDFNLSEIGDISNICKSALYNVNKDTGDIIFMCLIPINLWIDNGIKSKFNNKSVYFWNDKLPNQWCLKLKELKSELFVKSLDTMSIKSIKDYCKSYATEKYLQFADGDTKRNDKTKINNIASGLLEQIKLYLILKKDGHNVTMLWNDKDDLGVDISLEIKDKCINIDVKSTKDDMLKISKFRKETDFYAVIKEEKLLGYINKHDFWQSNITGSKAPVKNEKTGLFEKKLTKTWIKTFLKIDKLYDNLNTYNIAKLKRKSQLFEL